MSLRLLRCGSRPSQPLLTAGSRHSVLCNSSTRHKRSCLIVPSPAAVRHSTLLPAGGLGSSAGRSSSNLNQHIGKRKLSGRQSRSAVAAAAPGFGDASRLSAQHADRQPAWQRLLVRLLPILRNTELLRRCGATILLVALARFGCFVPIPNVDLGLVQKTGGPLADMLTGAYELPVSINQLGLAPFLNASIFVSMLQASKYFSIFKLWENMGAEGQAILLRLTRIAAITFAFLMGSWEASWVLSTGAVMVTDGFKWKMAVYLSAGLAVLMQLCDSIKQHGISDGFSLVLGLSIMSGYSVVLRNALTTMAFRGVSLQLRVAAFLVPLCMVWASVILTQTELRLPLVHYRTQAARAAAKQAAVRNPETAVNGQSLVGLISSDHMPLRISPNGMMSLIFGSIIAMMIAHVLHCGPRKFGGHGLYCVLLWACVASMEALWGLIGGLAEPLSKCLVQLDAGFKGRAPGIQTERFVRHTERRLRFIGGALMGCLAVLAHLLDTWTVANTGVNLGTTNVLLIASLATSTITQVQTLLQAPDVADLMQRETEALSAL